jgi:transposase
MPGTIHMLEATVDGLNYELHMREIRLKEQSLQIKQLQHQVEALKKQAMAAGDAQGDEKEPTKPPPWVKANLPMDRERKKPGRKKGHEPALRPKPRKIDRHQDVPLATDDYQQPICPRCQGRLNKLRRHKRLIEDLIRQAVQTCCYHTQSGYCPACRKRVESRAIEQPPAANLPHGQLGINALTTAMILRVRHRLPFRQISQLLMDLPGLSVSAGGIVKQIKRIARWLDGKYKDLIRRMRASPHVHADETGWRIDGRNFWLWAFTDPTFTLYHVDESRGGKVPLELLGQAFGGTVIADFYSGYNALSGPKQRCLTHLMREIKQLNQADAVFAGLPLSRKLLRWCSETLRLKKRWDELKDKSYDTAAKRLEKQLDQLISAPAPDHPDARRLHKRLVRHRPELTRFLWEEKLDGTNNAAERALRPAVVMRKITGGSRNQEAANAWAKLASLVRTADQKGLGVFDAAKKLILEYWAAAGR